VTSRPKENITNMTSVSGLIRAKQTDTNYKSIESPNLVSLSH